MNTHTHDPIARMTLEESRELYEANRIEESLWGITIDDDNNEVTLSLWFKGDKRYGIDEVFYSHGSTISDVEDAIHDLISARTSLTRDNFHKDCKYIRVRSQEKEKKLRDQMAEWPDDEITDLQLILSMAQAHAEFVYNREDNVRIEAIQRFASRAIHARAVQIVKSQQAAR